MTDIHLSDQELQQIACNGKLPGSAESEHLAHCEICQSAVAVYRMLVTGIQHQPKPAFDFDVATLVLPQIQPATATASREKWFIYLMPVVLAVIGGPVYLLRKNIFYVFAGISTFLMYVVAGAALIVLAYRILLMYREYKKRIRALNFY
jgi:hypothetical protein